MASTIHTDGQRRGIIDAITSTVSNARDSIRFRLRQRRRMTLERRRDILRWIAEDPKVDQALEELLAARRGLPRSHASSTR